jgi:hypothetical protein
VKVVPVLAVEKPTELRQSPSLPPLPLQVAPVIESVFDASCARAAETPKRSAAAATASTPIRLVVRTPIVVPPSDIRSV